MVGYLYAHRVPNGIKIGYADNYEKRKSQYASSGEIINLIRKIEIDDFSIDANLKKGLIDLNYRVVIKGQNSTEVYNLNNLQLNKIFDYIESEQSIDTNTLEKLINIIPVWEYKYITMREYKKLYKKQYIKFKYQRNVVLDHVDEIVKYMCDNYQKPIYYMPPIIAVKNGNTYAILDGLHRSEAITQINDTHDILNTNILIHQRNEILSDEECISIFKSINSSKPVPKLYIESNFIEKIHSDTITIFKKRFGNDAITDDIDDKLTEFITNDNIIKLIDDGKINGIDSKEIANILIDLNDKIDGLISGMAGGELILSSTISINNQQITPDQYKEILELYRIFNKNNKYLEEPLKKKLETIRKNTKTVIISKKKTINKYEPLTLSLIRKNSYINVLENIKQIINMVGYEL